MLLFFFSTATAVVTVACSDDAASPDELPDEGVDASADGAAPGYDAAKPSVDGATGEGGPGNDTLDAGNEDAGDEDADAAPSPTTQLDFSAEPTSGYSGVVLGAVTVRVRDAQGQLVSAPTSVTLTLTSGPGVLDGTVVRTTNAGLATFEDLTVSKSGTYTLTATTADGTAESGSFEVNAWQPYNGSLTGGTVRRVVVDPTDPKIAFALADGAGIFRTTDGATWSPIATGLPTLGLAIDPVTPTTIYAGRENNGLWRSTDRGDTWNPVNTGYADRSTLAVAIDKTNPQVIYWATTKGLLKSTDGGASWTPIDDPALATMRTTALAVAPSNTQTVYVQCANQQVYVSTNGGGSWSAMSGLPANATVSSLAIHPTDAATVYAGLGQSKGGLWKSTGGGAFTQVASAPVATASIMNVAIDPSSPQTMYVAAYGSNAFKSTDGGATWTNLNDNIHGAGSVFSLAIAPSDTSTVYVGHYPIGGGGLTKTTNGGTTWADASKGLVAFSVKGIAIDPTDSTGLWVGGGYISVNRSTDTGVTYTKLGVADGLTWDGDFVVRYAKAPGTIFLGNNGGGLFKSTNNGVSFVRDTVLGNAKLEHLALSPADASTIYGGGYGYGLVATTNGGTSWTTTNTPQNPYIYVYGLAAHPTVAATAYVSLSNGVYRTTDAGQTWTLLPTPSPALVSPLFAFDSANQLIAAGRSVQTSLDGETWTDITTSGGTTVPTANAAASYAGAFKVEGADVVFIGAGTKGLWRRANSTWSASLTVPLKILTMAQDPAHPKTLYVGLETGGMYRSLSGGE